MIADGTEARLRRGFLEAAGLMGRWEPWILAGAAFAGSIAIQGTLVPGEWMDGRIGFPVIRSLTVRGMVLVGFSQAVLAVSFASLTSLARGRRGIDFPLVLRLLPSLLTAIGLLVGVYAPAWLLMDLVSKNGPASPWFQALRLHRFAIDAGGLLAAWYLFGREASQRGMRAPGVGSLCGPGLLTFALGLTFPKVVLDLFFSLIAAGSGFVPGTPHLFLIHRLLATALPLFAALWFYRYLASGAEEAAPVEE